MGHSVRGIGIEWKEGEQSVCLFERNGMVSFTRSSLFSGQKWILRADCSRANRPNRTNRSKEEMVVSVGVGVQISSIIPSASLLPISKTNHYKTLFLGFGFGFDFGFGIIDGLKTASSSSSSSRETGRRRRSRNDIQTTTTTTSSWRIKASLMESPVLWAGRLCIFYALLKSGLAGSLSNPLLSGPPFFFFLRQ